MTSALRLCPKCGAEIPADAPGGGCPGCLLQTGLDLLPREDEGPTHLAQRQRTTRSERFAELLGELGDYELLEEIGRGGQGVVYRARQKSLNRTVALKVISLGQWASRTHLKRFRREAEAAASLDHPSIVPIYEVGERDGSCFFSMKFVEGGQLDEVVRRAPLSTRQAAELIAKVARTVHYAHEHGILHRDIKPGNILLDRKGEPHLTDFGLARLVESESTVTRTMEVMGTPSYMAPEQAVGNNAAVNSTTDVYGLGAVLYQLLTSHPPFAGGTTYETIKLVLDTEPRQPRAWNPKIDRDLSTICLKCLEKDPKRRYSSALALAEDLEHWLKHEPIRARRTGVFTRSRKWVRRNPSIAVMAAMLLALILPLSVMIWKSETEQLPASNLVGPEKSIAVLPFSNLSKEPENAFFADGVQDEILTDLARIADLKVISRTSVMHYNSPASAGRNLREIGRQLGVANLVEGSVQRSGNRVRVNAQLIDARTDRHLWGQTYDRDLADVFAIQSEIAKSIADQLQVKLSPNEKNAIERAPTSDLTAFDLYTRAKNILLVAGDRTKAELQQAVDLLNQAVARDPSFFDAYCQLAYAHDAIYWYSFDHTSARLALSEAAIQLAARLRPNAGETHLARAWNLYHGYRDYDGALAEVELAGQSLSNDARVFGLLGVIQRRQGRWEESTQSFERTVELNPRDLDSRNGIARNHTWLRRYADKRSALARTLTIFPNDVGTKVELASVEYDVKADTRPWHQMIESIRANPAAIPGIVQSWFWCAVQERDATAAKNALNSLGENPLSWRELLFTRSLLEGLIAHMAKEEGKARSAFVAARAEQQKIVQAQPNDGRALCALGLIDAFLGRKEEALGEGRRAVELLPLEKDALDGARWVENLAMIAAWVGEKDLAFEQLESIIRRPSPLSYGNLKLMPFWDQLRGDPRFEKILEEAKQPVEIEATTSIPSERSIAVLPFENLSDDKEHAFFADGVQDDILTKLAKVADLKVISRTSVMQYRGKQNIREIGNALRVSHVLEGTVRRSSGNVHINAQLVDARTDAGIWAEEYDRDLSDVFAIETEVAQSIVNRLRAKTTAREIAAMKVWPTKDVVAYDLYVRATALIDQATYEHQESKKDLFEAVDLLNQAVAHDPGFLLAYCRLAEAHDQLYFQGIPFRGIDHTPNRLALAKAAIDSAFRLKPDSGEAHLALATHFYYGYFDYDRARDELAIALRTLPNNARIFELTGYIDRRQGRWHDAVHNFEHAMELDPRNVKILISAEVTYRLLGDYGQARETMDRVIAIEPKNIGRRFYRAWIDVEERADLRPAQAVIAGDPASLRDGARECFLIALWERNAAAADRALAAITEHPFGVKYETVYFTRAYAEGLAARMSGDEDGARAAFNAARTEQEKVARAQPDYYTESPALCLLGLIDAALGRKQEALSEGRRAVELLPVTKDAVNGPDILYFYAAICAQVGERDLAIEQLKTVAQIPAGPSYGDLRLDLFWDPLRGNPRFEKIVASLAPKQLVNR